MNTQVVVIDAGSGWTKAGLSGEDVSAPTAVFPSAADDGHHAIQRGIICNWDKLEKLYRRSFDELGAAPEERPVLLTETPFNSKTSREKMAELMFEKFHVSALGLRSQADLSLYASGRTTGIVVESGEGVTTIAPVHEGYLLPHAVLKTHFAGNEVTEFLKKMLSERGCSVSKEAARDAKEKIGQVALDFDAETHGGVIELNYVLPDGTNISVGAERFRCPEALFQPSLMGIENSGIAQVTYESIHKVNVDIREDMYGNVVLSGGNTMFPGFGERMQKELVNLAPHYMKIKVVAPPERRYGAWVGGNIFAGLPTFESTLITKGEYDESGPSIVHRIA